MARISNIHICYAQVKQVEGMEQRAAVEQVEEQIRADGGTGSGGRVSSTGASHRGEHVGDLGGSERSGGH